MKPAANEGCCYLLPVACSGVAVGILSLTGGMCSSNRRRLRGISVLVRPVIPGGRSRSGRKPDAVLRTAVREVGELAAGRPCGRCLGLCSGIVAGAVRSGAGRLVLAVPAGVGIGPSCGPFRCGAGGPALLALVRTLALIRTLVGRTVLRGLRMTVLSHHRQLLKQPPGVIGSLRCHDDVIAGGNHLADGGEVPPAALKGIGQHPEQQPEDSTKGYGRKQGNIAFSAGKKHQRQSNEEAEPGTGGGGGQCHLGVGQTAGDAFHRLQLVSDDGNHLNRKLVVCQIVHCFLGVQVGGVAAHRFPLREGAALIAWRL